MNLVIFRYSGKCKFLFRMRIHAASSVVLRGSTETLTNCLHAHLAKLHSFFPEQNIVLPISQYVFSNSVLTV